MAQGVSGGLSDDDGLGDLPRMPNGNPYEEAFFDADWGPVESSDEATWIVLTEYDKETGEIARHHYLHAAEETESKALSPRNLPPEDAVPGLRALEEEILARLERAYDKAVRALRRSKGRALSRKELEETMGSVMASLADEFAQLATRAAGQAYLLGIHAETEQGLPKARFEGHDEGVLELIRQEPDALPANLSKVVADVHGVLQAAIRGSFERGVDTPGAIEEAAKALDAERWKIERVVRSKTSEITNRARAAQWEKYVPDADVDWVPSR